MALPLEDRPPKPKSPGDLTQFVRGLDPLPQAGLPPEALALLEVIAGTESAGKYDVIYGGSRFDDFTNHPRKFVEISSGPNKGKYSSAAGKYQFLGSTWDKASKALGLKDFSPESQDKAAWWLAEKRYSRDTGRDLLSDLQAGGNANMKRISGSLRKEWTSLPGGIEQGQNQSRFASTFNRALSGNLGRPVPPAGMASDPPTPKTMSALTSVKPGLEPMPGPTPRPRVEMELAKNRTMPFLNELPPVRPTIQTASLTQSPVASDGPQGGATARDLSIFRQGYLGGSPTSNAEGRFPSQAALGLFQDAKGPYAPAPLQSTFPVRPEVIPKNSIPVSTIKRDPKELLEVGKRAFDARTPVGAAAAALQPFIDYSKYEADITNRIHQRGNPSGFPERPGVIPNNGRPSPSVGGVGGANIAGQVQLPRNVVPGSVQRDMAAIAALPRAAAVPTMAQMQAMRATPTLEQLLIMQGQRAANMPAPIPMPPRMRAPIPVPIPGSYNQMQTARGAPIPMPRRTMVAQQPVSRQQPVYRVVAPIPMTRAQQYDAANAGNGSSSGGGSWFDAVTSGNVYAT